MKFKVGDKVVYKNKEYTIFDIDICRIPFIYELINSNGERLGWVREDTLILVETDPHKDAEEFFDNISNNLKDIKTAEYERGYKQGYEARKDEESKSARMIVDYDADLLKAAYEEGLNDTWKVARKIMQIPIQERADLFGISPNKACFADISSRFSVSEAIDKLKAWKDKTEIKVGDEVRVIGSDPEYDDCDVGIVTRIRQEYMYVMRRDGSSGKEDTARWHKTGRRYDAIEEVLKQMQEG